MTQDIACPACGERERLRGERNAELIVLVCEACGHRWERDPRPACPNCEGRDLVEAPKAVVEKVRGDQMSVVGYTKVQLCRVCDASLIEELARTKAPLPPDAMPVVSRHAWGVNTGGFGSGSGKDP
jgi:RNA polymerase subunit RPABC4/transcription elongation factor Spt4